MVGVLQPRLLLLQAYLCLPSLFAVVIYVPSLR